MDRTKRESFDELLSKVLRDPEAWGGFVAQNARKNMAAFMARVHDLSARRQRAAERAREILEQTEVRSSWFEIASRKENRDPEIVRALLDIAKAQRTSSPTDARRLQQDAIYLATQLPDSLDRSEVLGLAHKELATTYMLMFECRKALEALDEAEQHYQQIPAGELPLAVVLLVRAVVYQRQDRHDEALLASDEAAAVFDRYGDKTLLLKARTVRANVYIDVGRLGEALDLWQGIIRAAREQNDIATVGQAHTNLGLCLYRLKRPAEAVEALACAIAIHEAAGDLVNLPRVRRTLAHIERERGEVNSALTMLRQARAEWDAKGCSLSGCEVAMDIAEILLEAGDYEGARILLDPLPRQFADAGHYRNAVSAAAYLKEAASNGKATPATVQHVRRFVADTRLQPKLVFAPPPGYE